MQEKVETLIAVLFIIAGVFSILYGFFVESPIVSRVILVEDPREYLCLADKQPREKASLIERIRTGQRVSIPCYNCERGDILKVLVFHTGTVGSEKYVFAEVDNEMVARFNGGLTTNTKMSTYWQNGRVTIPGNLDGEKVTLGD